MVLDTLGAVARGGAQTLIWLAVVAGLFFVPARLVIAELGAAFPVQGGPYAWARLAFGGYAGSPPAPPWPPSPWPGTTTAATSAPP